jgi:hypothetical protein
MSDVCCCLRGGNPTCQRQLPSGWVLDLLEDLPSLIILCLLCLQGAASYLQRHFVFLAANLRRYLFDASAASAR